MQSIFDEKFESEERINGETVLVYSYKLKTVVGNFPVNQTIWVSKTTGTLVKCVVEYSNGPIKTLTTTFDTHSITIDLPAQ